MVVEKEDHQVKPLGFKFDALPQPTLIGSFRFRHQQIDSYTKAPRETWF